MRVRTDMKDVGNSSAFRAADGVYIELPSYLGGRQTLIGCNKIRLRDPLTFSPPDVKVLEMSWAGEGELGELVEDRKRFEINLTTDGEELPRGRALVMACLKSGTIVT
jgi:hypothetical protein